MRDAQRPSTTRRAVLRTAAWTAPAVAVVAATPAHAASTTGSLLATFGATGISGQQLNPSYLFVEASGTSVTSSGALAAGDLMLVARLVTQGSGTLSANPFVPGWQLISQQTMSAAYQYPAAVAAGAAVPFPDVVFLATEIGTAGAFHLAFTAAGATSSQELVIETGAVNRAARRAPASASSSSAPIWG